MSGSTVLAYVHHGGGGSDAVSWLLHTVTRALVWIGLDKLLRHHGPVLVLALAGLAFLLLIWWSGRRGRSSARQPYSRRSRR